MMTGSVICTQTTVSCIFLSGCINQIVLSVIDPITIFMVDVIGICTV